MNSNHLKEIKKTLVMTDEQRSILVGLLLGDGHLETQNGGKTYRLLVEHSEKQRDYVDWLYQKFAPWIPGSIYERKRHGKYIHVGWKSYSHGSFRFTAQQFYRNKIKIIPDMIGKMLDPLAIAVWFMDDGSLKSTKHKTYLFHTYCFTKRDLEKLRDALAKNFGIQTTIQIQNGKYFRLYVLTESAKKFEDLVRPCLENISSMSHKMINNLPKE